MSRVVHLSDRLVNAARRATKKTKLSLSSQITHWVELGRIADAHLTGRQVYDLLAPKRSRVNRKHPFDL
jgi:hypothetical protein